MKYIVKYGDYGMNAIESNSRNAKQHLRNLGGNSVSVYNKGGKLISRAERDGDGTIYSCYVGN